MIQNGFYVSLRKTKIVSVNAETHLLPPDLGGMQEFKVSDYFCPPEWTNDGIFVRVEENQPLWLDLTLNNECACIPSVQRLNPITGEAANLEEGLKKDPKQNYLKLPDQKWLDGYAKDGKVYQFIITKQGVGLAVNEYVLPKHMQDSHAIGLAFFPPKVVRNLGNTNSLRKCAEENPMWFSPLHTPQNWQNWQIASNRKSILNQLDNTYKPTYTDGLRGMSLNSVLGSEGAIGSSESLGKASCSSDVFLAQADFDNIDHTQFDKASMGAGGRIEQSIETDPNTPAYYTEKPAAVLTIYLSLAEQFDAIMSQGKRQDAKRPDKFIASGEIGGVYMPLISA